MNKIYIISDTHFNHKMLIKEKKRNFKTVKDMNNRIINNWNKIVADDDIVYHLGDVALNKKTEFSEKILPQLNGTIIFIRGNHDNNVISSTLSLKVRYKGDDIEFIHNPAEASRVAKYVIHGHIHNGVKFNKSHDVYYYNAVVELNNYKPKLLSEIMGELKKYEKNNHFKMGDTF